ncbi:MAG: hypothetical protein NTW19_05930 [Planctomycetota bacterium]|nr:hypothetical protein [Planctomycetota bacterium]
MDHRKKIVGLVLRRFAVVLAAQVALLLPATARAAEIVTLNEGNFDALAPRGDKAEAILGDYVLRNDRIVLVIDNPEISSGFASNRMYGMRACGSIIDMAPCLSAASPGGADAAKGKPGLWANEDRLGWFWTGPLWQPRDYAGRAQYDPHYAKDFRPQSGKKLTLEFDHTWHIDLIPMRVKYTIEDGQPFVRCETIYPNDATPQTRPAAAGGAASGAASGAAGGAAGIATKSDAGRLAEAAAPAAPQEVPGLREPPKPRPILPDPICDLVVDCAVERGVDAEQRLTWVYDPWFGQAAGQAFGVVEDEHAIKRLADGKEVPADPHAPGPINTGEELRIVRRVFVAPDLFALRQAVDETLGLKGRAVKLTVAGPEGSIAGARVSARRVLDPHDRPGDTTPAPIYGGGRTDAKGLLECTLPDGEFELRVEVVGRATKAVRIPAQGPFAGTAQMSMSASVAFDVTDEAGKPIPCKVEVRGRDGTPDPYFFPETGDRAVRNLLYLPDGLGKQAIAPGQYDLIFTRGPEYDAVTQPLEITSASANGGVIERTVHAKLVRSVDSTGWISVDFNSESTLSNRPLLGPPATGSTLGHVLNLLCEGIEFAPTAEFGRITDCRPIIESLGAAQFLATCPGTELADGNRGFFGFPLQYHPRLLDGGAPQMPNHVGPQGWLRHMGAPPDDPKAPWTTAGVPGNEKCVILRQYRNLPAKPAVAPHLPHSAYRDSDLITPAGEPSSDYHFSRDTDDDGLIDRMHYSLARYSDALDVRTLDGLYIAKDHVPNDVIDWLQLRAAGYRLPAVASSAARDNFHGVGGLRTYVASATDAPDKIDPLDVARAITAGHAFMTTGPFVEATLTTAEKAVAIPGDLVATHAPTAQLRVRVQCPNWIKLHRVEFWINGRVDPALTLDSATSPERFAEGRVQFDQTIALQTKSDTQVVVIAFAHGPNYRRRGEADGKVARHVAVTNPIMVDAGGDGFVPMSPLDETIRVEPAIVAPIKANKGGPPGTLRLTITNHGDAPAESAVHLEFRPAGIVVVEGKPDIPFKLAAHAKTTIDVGLRAAGDTETEELLGGNDPAKMKTTLYIVRTKSPPGIAPAKLPIVVGGGAEMMDADHAVKPR